MASGSYTILPYINPPATYVDVTSAVSNIGLVDNNFTVPQTFAGIVDSANLSVAGTSRFTGKATFDAAPDFLAGINVAISEVDTGTLVVSGSSSLNGGLTVAGSLVLPASSVTQSMVSSGYVDLSNAQTIAGIKTLSSPPIMSGASISAASIPDSALSANNALLNSAQTFSGIKTFSAVPVLSGAGITSASIPDSALSANNALLSGVQTFSGAKTFSSAVVVPAISASGLISGSAGLTISAGASSVQALTATSVTAPTFTGALVGNASTATLASTVTVTSDNTAGTFFIPYIKTTAGSDALYVDDVTAPLLTYNPSIGSIAVGALASSGMVQALNGLTINATSLGGDLNINNGASLKINSTGTLTVGGASTLSSTLAVSGISTLSGGIVIPTVQIQLGITAGVITINLNNLSYNECILPASAFTANVTGIAVTSAIVNAKFNIYIIGGAAAHNINKNLSSGAVSQVNNLAGNTSISAGAIWRCQGVILSSTLMTLDFTNYT